MRFLPLGSGAAGGVKSKTESELGVETWERRDDRTVARQTYVREDRGHSPRCWPIVARKKNRALCPGDRLSSPIPTADRHAERSPKLDTKTMAHGMMVLEQANWGRSAVS